MNKKLFYCGIFFSFAMIFNFFDLHTTLISIGLGGIESNLFGRFILENNLLILKFLIPVISIVIPSYLYFKIDEVKLGYGYFLGASIFSICIFGYAVIYNSMVILNA